MQEGQDTSSTAQRYLSANLVNLGDVQTLQGDLNAAIVTYRKSLAIAEKLAAQDPGNAVAQRGLSNRLNRLGSAQLDQGDMQAAGATHGKALEIAEKLVAVDPSIAQAQRELLISLRGIGNVQWGEGTQKLPRPASPGLWPSRRNSRLNRPATLWPSVTFG